MNKVGVHYAYWNHDWKADFVQVLKKAHSLGYEAVDFDTVDLMAATPEYRKEVRHVAEELGLTLAFAPATGDDVDIACKDKAIRDYGVDYFRRCIDFTAEMGSKILCGIIYSAWGAKVTGPMNYEDKQAALERSKECVAKILPEAEKCGVYYGLEVVNRFEQYLLNTTAEGIAYVDDFKSPNLKLLLDTFHMNIEEDDIPAAIRAAGDRVIHFHVGEANRRVPGQGADGRMPWNGIFRALNDINYQGVITMEPFVRMGGEVGKAVSLWRDLVTADGSTLDQDARDSIAFVKKHIELAERIKY